MNDITPETLFSPRMLWQSWLDVEIALAEVQAELGMIPAWAAEGIAAVADVDTLGLAALEHEAARTRAPIHALTRVVADRAGPAGAWFHWGATTQNVMQAGRLLLMRRAHREICAHVAGAVARLSDLADSHAETPMIGRTNRRHALPISFGFKVAGWIEELDRAVDRLLGMERRVFVLPFGGAVGAMHAFEGRGEEINRLMAARLGMRELLVPGRAVNDIFADYVVQLALWATTLERIAGELYVLMGEEIEEVAETLDAGVVGSSTMPHKVNPKLVVHVIAMAADLRAAAAPAMEGALSVNEGDAAANHLVARTLDRACPLAWTLSRRFEHLCANIAPSPERMAANLVASKAHAASERLMMKIAPELGHLAAHDTLHDIVAEPDISRETIAQRVVALPQLKGRLTLDEARDALDPVTYLGESARIARQGAELGRALADRLRGSE
ncbi:adenylosuccinate lyase family protein [Halovulum dunhuangense]|uniref:Adenylosuccinate lyase family protein n=1 Tax=Halovulum dunhuangense TaxID=1505036 RepID=A0A849KYA2_9RHOB|nr:lyase family protein [Halovulum dunhuangense]NNU79046.1 adenylosuccinate lyase family protein [Halovulum dunhuangense]